MMDPKVALNTMCKRCNSHLMCQGTGCEPRRVLNTIIDEKETYDKLIKEWDEIITKIQRLEAEKAKNQATRISNASL